MAKKKKETVVDDVVETTSEKENKTENKRKDAKRLKKLDLLEILVAMSEENEALKKRNDQLERLLEESATHKVNANIDTSNLINEIIESIGEIFHSDHRPTQPDITAKVREIYTQRLSEDKKKNVEIPTQYEDVWSGKDEPEEISSKYLKFSTYEEYTSNN